MKKVLFLLCTLPVVSHGLSRADLINFKLRKVEPNAWLETALLHNPEDVYCGLGPYSVSALGHAEDALRGGANPNGHREDNGQPYLVGQGAEFTELLLRYGANPEIDNGAAFKAARNSERFDKYKVIELLEAAKNKKRKALGAILKK